MLFNSFPYIFLFLPLSVILYFSLNKFSEAAGQYWLVLVSLAFYSFGAATYLPLLLLSLGVNYALGQAIRWNSARHPGPGASGSPSENRPGKSAEKVYLVIGVIFNIGLLAFFKYSDFFILNINQAGNLHLPFLRLAVPLAISFYTFQQISYLVDTYRKEIISADFLSYCLFVTFFPRLLIGPITRYNELIPQFHRVEQRSVDYQNLSIGLFLFFLGLLKRVAVADTFGVYADLGYAATSSLSLAEAWITSVSYTFQIYFDFSGYTDMAIGTAYFFNIKLPVNFNSPYLAVNIQDFWRRWHVTLSRFLRDYLYIPLGGSRKGAFSTFINIMITFLIGGFWHGAGWTFIAWGAIHGVALCIHRAWSKFNLGASKFAAILMTFSIVNIAWVFFRADSLQDAIQVLKAMVGRNGLGGLTAFQSIDRFDNALAILIGSLAGWIVFSADNSNTIPQRMRPSGRVAAILVLLIVISLFFLNSTSPKGFIYNDF